MTYFTLFDSPENLLINPDTLQKKYYDLCKQYHPDAQQTEENAIKTTISDINKAYETLKDADKRLAYLLTEKELLSSDTDNKKPIDGIFLAKMMDINEKIMDWKMAEKNEQEGQQIIDDIKHLMAVEQEKVKELLNKNDLSYLSVQEWQNLLSFYLKRQYLKRAIKGVE